MSKLNNHQARDTEKNPGKETETSRNSAGVTADNEQKININSDTSSDKTDNIAEKPADVKGQNAKETAETPAVELTPDEKIAALEAELAELRDQLLRKAADFENFRKRMNQEKQSAIEYANQSLLMDIIPIIDDFERAIQSSESSRDFSALYDGINMIEKRLISQLDNKWGLKRFNSVGEPFDPNRHEALMMEKSPEVSEAVVAEDLIKGYMLKDRLLRAAKVKVILPDQG